MAQAHHAGVPLPAKAQGRKHPEEKRQQEKDAPVVGPVVQIPLILLGKSRAAPLLGIQQGAVHHTAVIIRQRLARGKPHRGLRARHSQHHNGQKRPAPAHKRVQKAAALGCHPCRQQPAQPGRQQAPLHQRGKGKRRVPQPRHCKNHHQQSRTQRQPRFAHTGLDPHHPHVSPFFLISHQFPGK